MAPDKQKLKELIQKSATKDLLYLHINPVEPKSLESALKELQKFVGKGGAEVVVVRDLFFTMSYSEASNTGIQKV